MTTIAALRHGGRIFMACDTMAADNSGRVWDVRSKLKIMGSRGRPVVFGNAGHRAVGALIERHIDFAALSDADEVNDAMQDVAEQIAEVLRDHHVPTCDDGLIDGAQLVATHHDRLWMLTDGLAEPVDADYTTIGSGADLALGYLAAAVPRLTPPHFSPEDAVREAIATAGRYDTQSGGLAHVVCLEASGEVVDCGAEIPVLPQRYVLGITQAPGEIVDCDRT